jgi:hypothetical protein
MTDEQRFYTVLNALADLVPNFTLSKEQVILYANGLRDLGWKAAGDALEKIMRERKGGEWFPSIRDVREKIVPVIDDADDARAAAARIIAAVAKYGWPNPVGAKAFIGELGWMVVEQQGGWAVVCQEMNEHTRGTMQAQMRDLALSLQRRARAGQIDAKPALPKPSALALSDRRSG